MKLKKWYNIIIKSLNLELLQTTKVKYTEINETLELEFGKLIHRYLD
jgi:hypothetical protein